MTTTPSLRDAAQLLIESLEIARDAYEAWGSGTVKMDAAIASGRAALALPEAEPVAWTLTETLNKRETTTRGYLWFSNPVNCCWTPLYTTPQAAPVERKPLIDEQISEHANKHFSPDYKARGLHAMSLSWYRQAWRDCEQSLGIKGTA